METTTAGQQQFLDELDDLVDRLIADGAAAIGVGVPMNLDRRTGIGLGAVNLPLRSLDLAGHLRARFAVPVGVENDGNAIALAEWRVGAGQGATDLVALALGTGVGGGVVIDGRLYRGWAELGHVVVVADGPACQGTCHGHGHLEAVASGEAAERAAVELWGEGADAHRLVQEALAGDDAARSALARIGHYLGIAIGSFANIFAPDVVIVGGGLRHGGLGASLRAGRGGGPGRGAPPADDELRIVQAALGDDAGLVGAALVGFEALDGLR